MRTFSDLSFEASLRPRPPTETGWEGAASYVDFDLPLRDTMLDGREVEGLDERSLVVDIGPDTAPLGIEVEAMEGATDAIVVDPPPVAEVGTLMGAEGIEDVQRSSRVATRDQLSIRDAEAMHLATSHRVQRNKWQPASFLD